MDIADLIANFSTGGAAEYVVTRRARAIYVAGRPTPGASSKFTIVGSVQPAAGRDLLRLPEGRRTIETRVIYTSTELTAGGQGAAHEADLVQIGLNTWEVQHVEEWIDSLTQQRGFRCIAQKPAVIA